MAASSTPGDTWLHYEDQSSSCLSLVLLCAGSDPIPRSVAVVHQSRGAGAWACSYRAHTAVLMTSKPTFNKGTVSKAFHSRKGITTNYAVFWQHIWTPYFKYCLCLLCLLSAQLLNPGLQTIFNPKRHAISKWLWIKESAEWWIENAPPHLNGAWYRLDTQRSVSAVVWWGPRRCVGIILWPGFLWVEGHTTFWQLVIGLRRANEEFTCLSSCDMYTIVCITFNFIGVLQPILRLFLPAICNLWKSQVCLGLLGSLIVNSVEIKWIYRMFFNLLPPIQAKAFR